MTSDEFELILEGLVDFKDRGLRAYTALVDHEKFLQYRVEMLEEKLKALQHIGTGAGAAVRHNYE